MRLLVLLCLVAGNAWAAEYWACGSAQGAADGTSLASCWDDGGIVYGGANAAGRANRRVPGTGVVVYRCPALLGPQRHDTGFKPFTNSPLCAAGTFVGPYHDYSGFKFNNLKPSIGAYECTFRDPDTITLRGN